MRLIKYLFQLIKTPPTEEEIQHERDRALIDKFNSQKPKMIYDGDEGYKFLKIAPPGLLGALERENNRSLKRIFREDN